MRSTVCAAWSRPSTENTPRICGSWLGTSRSRPLSVGLRKNWSSDFSSSLSVAAQFPDHGAHGLAVADAAVQLFHPGLERLRAAAVARQLDAAGELDGRAVQLRDRADPDPRRRLPGRGPRSRLPSPVRWPAAGRIAPTASTALVSACDHRRARRMQLLQRFAELVELCRPPADVRFTSPPDSADHISLAASMRLRACASTTRVEAAELLDRVVDRSARWPRPRRRARRAGWRPRRARRARPVRRRTAGPGASRSETVLSPRASVAYCSSTREAARFTWTSAGISASARASKKPAASVQKTRDPRHRAPRPSPRHSACSRRAAWSSPLLTTLSTSRSSLERTAGS